MEELIFLLLNGESDVFEFIKDVYAQTKEISDTYTNNLIISRIDHSHSNKCLLRMHWNIVKQKSKIRL